MHEFYYVYILRSLKDGMWYIGFTTDIKRRLKEHNEGTNRSTKNRQPFKLIYFEGYLCEKDAKGREKFLKSGSGHRFMRKQLKNYLTQNLKKN